MKCSMSGGIYLLHEDEQLAIHRVDFYRGLSIYGVRTKERTPFGQRAWPKRHEFFNVIEGRGVLFHVWVNDAGHFSGRSTREELETGAVVHIEPMKAYSFYLEPGSQMTCSVVMAFDGSWSAISCPNLTEENWRQSFGKSA